MLNCIHYKFLLFFKDSNLNSYTYHMKFEILLDNDPALRDKARKNIEKIAGTASENFITGKDYPEFGHLIEINAPVSDADVWKFHDTLMEVKGVVDADPEPNMEDQEDEINARYFAESPLYSSAAVVRPRADWYHHNTRFPEAVQWALSAYTSGKGHFNNQRVKIAQLDTGYTHHPEVKQYKISEGYNFLPTEDAANPYDRLLSTRPIPVLWGGHGTSCAGVMIGSFSQIAEREPSPDDQLYFDDLTDGLFPNVDLIPYRVSQNIISFSNKLAKGLQRVIEKGDIQVVSISHANLLPKRALWLAVKEAANRGIIVVAAAGSHVKGFKKIFTYPAKYDEAIAVAASTAAGLPWKLTHGGPEVDFCAPGYEIYIPFPYRKRGKEYYAYKWSEGSSFSVPITACAAALWLAHHGIDQLKKRFTGREITELFRNTCRNTVTPFSAGADTSLYGSGMLNVKQLLSAPLSQPKAIANDIKSAAENSKGAIDRVKKLIEADKNSYIKDKELVYHTLMAKLETEDLNEELSDFVFDHLSSSGKNIIGKRLNSDEIKSRVKSFTTTYY